MSEQRGSLPHIDTGSPAQRAARAKEFNRAPTPLEKIRVVLKNHPEMTWLTGETDASPVRVQQSQTSKTIGELLFPDKTPDELKEFNRTAVGILTLDWILKGDYKAFTECQKDKTTKLSWWNFRKLHKYAKRILPTDEAVDAMITYMVINDLGKIKSFVNNTKQITGIQEVDHDKVLLAGLEADPDISPSYQSLSPKYKEMIKKGLAAKFNIGQFIQGENIPASLEGLPGVDKNSLDFYLLHALTDIAGAAGQGEQNGSALMTNPTYRNFRLSIRSLEALAKGRSLTEVYDSYLQKRAKPLGLDISDTLQRGATRIACMLGLTKPKEAQQVMDVLKTLPANTRAILEKELNKNGINDGYATLIYYAPALLKNLHGAYKAAGDPEALTKSLREGLTMLARVYQEARIILKGREGNGVYTVLIEDLAKKAADDPQALRDMDILLSPVGNDAIGMETHVKVDVNHFPRIESLSSIPGQRIATIGLGGGSDGNQATQVLKLLEKAGKTAVCSISIRPTITGSQSGTGALGEERTVNNHGGEVTSGVFRILPQTTGSGRFLENLSAQEVPTYLIIDNGVDDLTVKIQAALTDAGGVDTAIGVDTGGDALYPINDQDLVKATPDQDLRSLEAIDKLQGINTLSNELQVGIDSPSNAEEILLAAEAGYYDLSSEESRSVLELYRRWEMDGSNPHRYGKTPLAWQAALQGQTGYVSLPLPTHIVIDDRNPWNPFVHVQPASAGMFFMSTSKHLAAIRR